MSLDSAIVHNGRRGGSCAGIAYRKAMVDQWPLSEAGLDTISARRTLAQH